MLLKSAAIALPPTQSNLSDNFAAARDRIISMSCYSVIDVQYIWSSGPDRGEY